MTKTIEEMLYEEILFLIRNIRVSMWNYKGNEEKNETRKAHYEKLYNEIMMKDRTSYRCCFEKTGHNRLMYDDPFSAHEHGKSVCEGRNTHCDKNIEAFHRRPPLPRERILEIILENSEGIRQKKIAEILRINPSSLSELIDKLEADGYLERKPDESDKRATLIFITEKGKARAYEVADERREQLNSMFKNIDKEEKEQLLKILQKLHN